MIQRSPADWQKLFSEHQQSGQSAAAFCREHKLCSKNFNKRRKALPENLPRLDVLHELEEAERICEHDGNPQTEIGEVISEQLDIIPAKFQVIRHIRKKYACSCAACIKTAPLPNQPIPKSIASSGLPAHIGVDIPRAMMANWCGFVPTS